MLFFTFCGFWVLARNVQKKIIIPSLFTIRPLVSAQKFWLESHVSSTQAEVTSKNLFDAWVENLVQPGSPRPWQGKQDLSQSEVSNPECPGFRSCQTGRNLVDNFVLENWKTFSVFFLLVVKQQYVPDCCRTAMHSLDWGFPYILSNK